MSEVTKTFNLENEQEAERKLLVTAVNVGTSTTKEFEVVGVNIEDSAIELNPEIETKTDILGITRTRVKKMEPQQSLEPFTIAGGSKLAMLIRNLVREQKLSEMSAFEVLIIEGYVGQEGAYEAELHKNCTIVANSLGGSATVDMPIEIHFSNDKTLGSVDKLKGEIKFTPSVTVPTGGNE